MSLTINFSIQPVLIQNEEFKKISIDDIHLFQVPFGIGPLLLYFINFNIFYKNLFSQDILNEHKIK